MNAKQTREWTRPYCGVSHLVTPKGARFQFTVEQHSETFTVASVIHLNALTRSEDWCFDSSDDAKAWLEKKAVELGIVEVSR